MTPPAELTPPMEKLRRFPTVEDETPTGEASQIPTTMSTSASFAATEATATSSTVAAVEPPSHDIADVVLSSLLGYTKPQPMESAIKIADGEKSYPGSVKRDAHMPYQFPIRSAQYYTYSQRTSPEQVFSIFPTELPPRPPQKQSFLKRLQGSSTRPSQTDKQMSHDHTYRTPDIELAAPGEALRSHDVNRSRSLMFWLLIMLGICLSSIIGIVIHWAVIREE